MRSVSVLNSRRYSPFQISEDRLKHQTAPEHSLRRRKKMARLICLIAGILQWWVGFLASKIVEDSSDSLERRCRLHMPTQCTCGEKWRLFVYNSYRRHGGGIMWCSNIVVSWTCIYSQTVNACVITYQSKYTLCITLAWDFFEFPHLSHCIH